MKIKKSWRRIPFAKEALYATPEGKIMLEKNGVVTEIKCRPSSTRRRIDMKVGRRKKDKRHYGAELFSSATNTQQ